MTYATLNRAQGSWGVKVPYGQGSYTVHYDNEAEALEVIEGLNRAYKAGFEAGERSVTKGRSHALSNTRNSVSG